MIRQLPLADWVFASQFSGDTFYCSGHNKVWLVRMHVDDQIKDLVKQYRVDDAFDLLTTLESTNCILRRRNRSRGGKSIMMAGFEHLYHGQPARALHYLSSHVDHAPAMNNDSEINCICQTLSNSKGGMKRSKARFAGAMKRDAPNYMKPVYTSGTWDI